MKSLPLSNASFRYLEQGFAEWLDILGYAESSVYAMPILVRELLFYLEQQGVNQIKELDIKHIHAHFEQLKERSNQRCGGGLSTAHLNKHIQALEKFTDYLRKVGRIQLPALKLRRAQAERKLTFLSEEEIRLLIQASYQPIPDHKKRNPEQQEAFKARDRAMIAVYYGCGLRRNEGVHLNLSDINFDKAILHVRKGKNYKERLVPISKTSLKYLQEYIYDHRPMLIKSSTVDALFLSQRGVRMQGQSLFLRLKQLIYLTGDLRLQEKETGLHTLRHSIATHLLAAGMSIDNISKFLGHSSLESTQIYTHLAGLEQEQDYSNIPTYETGKLHEDE